MDDNTTICNALRITADDTKRVADETKRNTDDIVDFFKGMRVVGVLSKWLTTVSVVAIAFWVALKGGR